MARLGNFIRSLHVQICFEILEHCFLQDLPAEKSERPRYLSVLVWGFNDGYGSSERKGGFNAVTCPHV